MNLFLQALMTSIIVWLGFLDKAFLHTFFYRPIIIGPMVGLVFGDFATGLEVGVSVELMFLAVIFVGTAIPPDETISAGLAAALACATGSVEVGIATALPISFVGQIFRQTRNSTIYEFTQRQVDKAAAEEIQEKLFYGLQSSLQSLNIFSLVYLYLLAFILELLMYKHLSMLSQVG